MEKIKHIVFTVSNDLVFDQRMDRICNSLYSNGYQVTFLGRKKKNSFALLNKGYTQKRLNLFFEKGKLFYIEINIRIFFYLFFLKFDIVCGIDLDTIAPAYFVSKLKSKTCVYDAHELFTEVPEVIARPTIKKIWLRIEKYMLTRVKNLYTVSQSVANEFEKRYRTKFEVIRNLPYKKNYNPSKNNITERIILYRGAVNQGRGLEQIIKAMHHIDAKLLIAGDGDILIQLKSLASQEGIIKKIVFTGYQTPEELDKLTQGAYLGINLLESESKNYYFSLANKFFDYMQFDIPQLCMNFPEYQNINSKYEVAVLINDLKESTISNHINTLLNNNELYNKLKLNCTLAAKDLCWENEEQKLLNFYKSL